MDQGETGTEWCMMRKSYGEEARGIGKRAVNGALALKGPQRLEVGVRAQVERSVSTTHETIGGGVTTEVGTTIHETIGGGAMTGIEIGIDIVTVTTEAEGPERMTVIGGAETAWKAAPRGASRILEWICMI